MPLFRGAEMALAKHPKNDIISYHIMDKCLCTKDGRGDPPPDSNFGSGDR